MRYTLKVTNGLWAVAVTTGSSRPYAVMTMAELALSTLTQTEGLSPGFYADDMDYVEAVVATFETTELWRHWGDELMELTIPYYGTTLTVDVTDARN